MALSMDNDEVNIEAAAFCGEEEEEEVEEEVDEDATVDGNLHTRVKKGITKITHALRKQRGAESASPAEILASQPHAAYSMSYESMGHCVIINIENFLHRTGFERRKGTHKDACLLFDCFSSLGFKVDWKNDLTCEEIRKLLKQVSQRSHAESACFVCAVLSHGDEGKVYGTDGELSLSEIAEHFSESGCPSLAGKPKLFFVQACRGSLVDKGVDMVECDGEPSEQETSVLPTVDLMRPDFLFAFSTVPGYYSWRNPHHGSWFIQSLCSELQQQSRQLEILEILTRVNRRVATVYKSSCIDPEMNAGKQIPCIVSMLTQQLYLRK